MESARNTISKHNGGEGGTRALHPTPQICSWLLLANILLQATVFLFLQHCMGLLDGSTARKLKEIHLKVHSKLSRDL